MIINVKTGTADDMIQDCVSDANEFSADRVYPYAFGCLSAYVRWLVEERDRLNDIILAYELRDEKVRENARDMLQEIKERSAEMRGDA